MTYSFLRIQEICKERVNLPSEIVLHFAAFRVSVRELFMQSHHIALANASWKTIYSPIPAVKMSEKRVLCQWRIWRWVVNPEESFKTKGDYVLSQYTSAFCLLRSMLPSNFLWRNQCAIFFFYTLCVASLLSKPCIWEIMQSCRLL